jgi:HEAT repeat protein
VRSSVRVLLERCVRRQGSYHPRPEWIPRSRDAWAAPSDDDNKVDALFLRVALGVLVFAFASWLVLSFAIVVGRLRYERARRLSTKPLSSRVTERLVRRAGGRPRTEWGRWRRVAALQRLEQEHHPSVPRLIKPALDDPDPMIAAAAIRTLGDLGDEWAIDVLLEVLRRSPRQRSRAAAELERLVPAPGRKLLPLLREWDPGLRFWGATLLRPYPELGDATLIELTWDADPNVRAAAVETLGTRSGNAVGAALVSRIDDSEWFVRVHAARAAGHVVGADAAPSITRLLADERWWVRTAAKDALRGMGADAVPSLLSILAHADPFARNGAAEVLQDVGFVDFLAIDSPSSPLLQRIYEAGGEQYRAAATARAEAVPEESVRAA